MSIRILKKPIALLALAAIVFTVAASPALAKDEDDENAPAVPLADQFSEEAPNVETDTFPLKSVGLTALAVVLCSLIAFKNSKRTHLD